MLIFVHKIKIGWEMGRFSNKITLPSGKAIALGSRGIAAGDIIRCYQLDGSYEGCLSPSQVSKTSATKKSGGMVKCLKQQKASPGKIDALSLSIENRRFRSSSSSFQYVRGKLATV